ncbi:MAG: gluconate 2-dehydrogenase subunit 3 family protein [Myxococcales bacterium]|nr:gluconate 2-dehydrogenase subunit 3 family protein [Myxococcales bacterium]
MASLTDAQQQALGAVLDALIPPRDELAGAGTLGLGDAVEREIDKMAGALDALTDALAALDASTGTGSFVALAESERAAALAAYAEADPGFLPGIIFHTYIAYYQDPRVIVALGLAARPPHPQGYEIAPSDFDALTARVRTREPFFRKP